jgi:hypothetical protein
MPSTCRDTTITITTTNTPACVRQTTTTETVAPACTHTTYCPLVYTWVAGSSTSQPELKSFDIAHLKHTAKVEVNGTPTSTDGEPSSTASTYAGSPFTIPKIPGEEVQLRVEWEACCTET